MILFLFFSEPNDENRLIQVGSGTNRPLTIKSLVPLPGFRDGLPGHRYRLTASLPDMPGYAFGSSVSALRQSPLLFSDPTMTFGPLASNQLPRSWQIIGQPEFWSRSAFVGRDIPSLSAAMKLLSVKDMETLNMMDNLKMMRNKWRQRSLAKAKSLYASPNFLSKLYPIPSHVMPDVGNKFQTVAGELGKEGKPLLGYKKAAFLAAEMAQQQGLANSRVDSFSRGLLKLNS